MSDSTPVPLSDLQPGDLLFYGPGGSDHVAMYVGPGTMIEAPETGESVHLHALSGSAATSSAPVVPNALRAEPLRTGRRNLSAGAP